MPSLTACRSTCCGSRRYDGDEWQWDRFDKALTPEQAEEMFKHFSRIAPTHGYRRVEIRHGRDEVVKEWTAPVRGRH